MFDSDDKNIEDVFEKLTELLEDDEIVKLMTELYFGLETEDRVEFKRNIG